MRGLPGPHTRTHTSCITTTTSTTTTISTHGFIPSPGCLEETSCLPFPCASRHLGPVHSSRSPPRIARPITAAVAKPVTSGNFKNSSAAQRSSLAPDMRAASASRNMFWLSGLWLTWCCCLSALRHLNFLVSHFHPNTPTPIQASLEGLKQKPSSTEPS